MPNVITPQPDIKVFFRRLLVPGELTYVPGVTLTPSQITGSAYSQDVTMPSDQQINQAFASYQPTQFKKQVTIKARSVATEFEDNLAKATANVASLSAQIAALTKELAGVSVNPSGFDLSTDQQNQLQTDLAFYPKLVTDINNFNSIPSSPTVPSPLSQASSNFQTTLNNVTSISNTIPLPMADIQNTCTAIEDALTTLIKNNVASASINSIGTSAITGQQTTGTLLSNLITNLQALDGLVGVAPLSLGSAINLEQQIAILNTQLNDAKSNLSVLKKSSALQPFYDPILLDCLLGPYSMQTSMNRKGQPGTGSVTFHLPLAANGQVPDLFFGLQVNDVFNMANLEKQVSSGSTTTRGSAIPARTLSILTANMRETTIAPFDMMQIWARRRYSVSANFPTDYYPIFTGFVTKTSVSYSGSTVAVKVDGEDVGRMVRLARINIDPQLDTTLNSLGLQTTVFGSSLIAAENQPNNLTGGEMVQSVIQGQTGSILGMSNATFVATTVNVQSGPGYVLATVMPATSTSAPTTPLSNQANTAPPILPVSGTTTTAPIAAASTAAAATKTTGTTTSTVSLGNQLVNLAWDFKDIKVNIFNDLANNWPPYATQLRDAFRMWETDELTKWEVCAQIAEVQEFEWYADNMGVLNYHPPLYYLNPFAPQYYIEDIDIISEAHSVDEKAVVTVMELDTQPSFFANGSTIDPIIQGRSFVQTSTPVLQRYAVRYQKKSSPIFSGTTPPPSGQVAPSQANQGDQYNVDQGRSSYCRALLNRRNAELKSATVTINGTPELRLCNTVAFVGNLGGALQSVSLNPFATSAPGVSLPANSTVSTATSTSTAPSTTTPNSTLTSLQQMLVYYISTINHSYTQGKDFTTTLGLTHGRHWTDALPSGSVGYGTSGPQTDETYTSMCNFYGQGNAAVNATNFVSVASAKLNFIATGNPAALNPGTSSQFGFTCQPVKASATRTFITKISAVLSTSVIRSALCNKQSKKKNPKQSKSRIVAALSQTWSSVVTAYNNAVTDIENAPGKIWEFLKDVKNKGPELVAAYLTKLNNFIGKEINSAEQELAALISNPEVLAFKAYLGSSKIKFVLRETFPTGDILQKTGASAFLAPLQQAGIDTTPIISFKFPIAAYIYVAQSPYSLGHALEVVAAQAIIADLPEFLGNTIKGVPTIWINTNSFLPSAIDRNHVSISTPSAPPASVPPSFTSMLSSFLGAAPSSAAPGSSRLPAPVITSQLSASAKVGVPFTYAIVALNNPTSYNALGLPEGLSINKYTGEISGVLTSSSAPAARSVPTTTTYSAPVGPSAAITTSTVMSGQTNTIDFTIIATNSSGSVQKNLSLTVTPSNQLTQQYYIMGLAIAYIDPKC